MSSFSLDSRLHRQHVGSTLAVAAQGSVLLCLERLTKGPCPSATGGRECDNSCLWSPTSTRGRVEVLRQLEQKSAAANVPSRDRKGETEK